MNSITNGKERGKSLIPASAFKACHECDKVFHIFRLKYRCRICYFCFCKAHVKDIQRANNKTLQICEICAENLNSTKTQFKEHHDLSASIHDESFDFSSVLDSKNQPTQEFLLNNRLQNFLQEIKGDKFSFFSNSIQSFILQTCEKLCESQKIDPN